MPPIHSGTWMSMIITSLGGPSQLNVGPSLGGAPIFRLTNDSWAEKEGAQTEIARQAGTSPGEWVRVGCLLSEVDASTVGHRGCGPDKHSGLQMQYGIAALWA